MEMAKPATSQIPVGFRFHPTDEEVVIHYLKRKVYSLQLPANVIPEFDVFETSPWGLPGELREKRYFFSKTRMDLEYDSSGRVSDGSGFWKAIGKEKKISICNQTFGMKKTLIFYKEKEKCTKTRWIMHQYFLVGTSSSVGGEWFVCSVFRRKKKPEYHFKKKGRPEISFDDEYDQEGSSDSFGFPSS